MKISLKVARVNTNLAQEEVAKLLRKKTDYCQLGERENGH